MQEPTSHFMCLGKQYIGATFNFIKVAFDNVDSIDLSHFVFLCVCVCVCRCSILLGCTSFGVCSLLDKVSLL